MSYYQQHYDPRYFAPNPQFPEPKKSSSWVGWLLMVIAALIGGFLFGQNTKIEVRDEPKDDFAPTNDKIPTTNDEVLPVAKVVVEPKTTPEPPKEDAPTRFADLSEAVVLGITNDFDNHNEAEKLHFKREFDENPELITKYPVLAQLLGFEVPEEYLDESTKPL